MKLTIIIILMSLAILSFLFISCNNKIGEESTNADFEVTYSKSKGKSKTKPQYTIELKGNKVNFNGIANVPVLGVQAFEISNAKLKIIQEAFDKSNFAAFDELYMGRIRDLPLMSITHKGHKVKYQEREAPQNLKELAMLLEDLMPKK